MVKTNIYLKKIAYLLLSVLFSCCNEDCKDNKNYPNLWFDHFDGDSSWTAGCTEFNSLSGGWQKAGKWSNGSPFLNLWLAGHVELFYNNSYLRLRLDDKDDGCAECLPHNLNCTVDSTLYSYASGEYRTNKKFGYGMFEAKMKASSLTGVVSSFFLYCNKPEANGSWKNIPEIDWEFFIGKAQTNFYDRDSTYNVAMINIDFNPASSFHVYGIKWMPDNNDLNDDRSFVSWYVDGNLVHGPVAVNFGEADSLKVMMNLWPVDSTVWPNPGVFDPGTGELPVYAEYDWAGYIPRKVVEENGISSFINFFEK